MTEPSRHASRLSRMGRLVLAGVVVGSLVLVGGASLAQEVSPPPDEGTKGSPPPASPETVEGDEQTQPDDVGDAEVASASLTATPLSGPQPLLVTFDPTGSSGVDAYRLDFGDGESTSGKGPPPTITHTYASPSAYTAVLTVFAGDATYTDSVTIEVEELVPTADETTPTPADDETDDPGVGDDPGDAGDAGEDAPPGAQQPDATVPDPEQEAAERSLFVSSVRDPTEVSLDLRLIAESLLLTAVLIMLIGFPAEMFNATLLENYEEISGWFRWSWLERFRTWISGLHGALVAVAFAAMGALIHMNLEPHFGFNRGSLALFVGLFTTFLFIALLYDVMRGSRLRRRHDLPNRLRAQALGMVVAAVLVLASRLGDFHPGYMYGLFTALVYGADLHERDHGRALALASARIGLVALVAWFLWIPVKGLAEEPDASFLVLMLDASLAVLWVAGLATIVFGLAPLRFFYGETVKKWSLWGWLALYIPGVFMFVYTLLHPERGLYGSSEDASLFSVMLLFVCFGVFSLAFWGYFKFRTQRRRSAAGVTS